jgi:hypothetical protein
MLSVSRQRLYITPNINVTDEKGIRRDLGRSRRDLIEALLNLREGLRKITKKKCNQYRRYPTKIRIKYLPNMGPECYRYTNYLVVAVMFILHDTVLFEMEIKMALKIIREVALRPRGTTTKNVHKRYCLVL